MPSPTLWGSVIMTWMKSSPASNSLASSNIMAEELLLEAEAMGTVEAVELSGSTGSRVEAVLLKGLMLGRSVLPDSCSWGCKWAS